MFFSVLISVFLFLYATGTEAFSVTTNNGNVQAKVGEGADLTCIVSADYGSNARVEWKFKDQTGSQIYVIYDGKPTQKYVGRVTFTSSLLRFTSVNREDNGEYNCVVSGNENFGEVSVMLTVLVPPSVPVCRVPSSVTTGSRVLLTCDDPIGSPPPVYTWFKDLTPLPVDPSKNPAFSNYTYTINANGVLEFPSVSLMDTGDYSCQSSNTAGPSQVSAPVRMVVRDVNVGGIVAGVIVALLAIILLCLALWYANRKGYLPKKSKGKPKPSVVYQPTSEDSDEGHVGEFRQKSSFVV
ncbi:hypothetical protein UPYG_G00114050 [Umbra pygmaea]|uniref:Junctional adhesion molecule A n=1 Tax=Umbra pygmaea TaxID=75934 RepID=A0ABD0X496_UMBPY